MCKVSSYDNQKSIQIVLFLPEFISLQFVVFLLLSPNFFEILKKIFRLIDFNVPNFYMICFSRMKKWLEKIQWGVNPINLLSQIGLSLFFLNCSKYLWMASVKSKGLLLDVFLSFQGNLIQKMDGLGRILICFGIISLLHAGYSTIQYKTYLKLIEEDFHYLPIDVRFPNTCF